MKNWARGEKSLVRRMAFAGNAKYFFSRIFANTFLLKILPVGWPSTLSNIFLRLSSILYDVIESIRTLKWVPEFGDYRNVILSQNFKLTQHKYYPAYKYFPDRHALIGLHLGVDLIRKDGSYYLLELNLDAAVRKYVRDLYPDEIDPIVMNYIRYAQEKGFSKVRLINSAWRPYFINEVAKAQSKYSIDIQAITHLGRKKSKNIDLVKIPDKLEKDTLYSFFCARHTPVGYLLHNKFSLQTWFNSLVQKNYKKIKRLKSIPGWFRFELPESIFKEQYWPQFVAKLSGWDAGKQTKVIKAKNLDHAKEILGIKAPDDFPKIFKMNLFHRLLGLIIKKNAVIYQQYIPLEFDEKRRLRSFRMHAFFAPDISLMLSTQGIHGSKAIGETIPYGPVPLDGSFISTIYHGAFYKLSSKTEWQEQEEVCRELGLVIHDFLTEKFYTTPHSKG